MASLVLDTVVASVISPFKKDSPQKHRYQHALAGSNLVLSAQTVAEMHFWAIQRTVGNGVARSVGEISRGFHYRPL